jgi:hypothetical protein
MKLDKSKPYGLIVNDSQGRAYEQGGRYFDLAGNEVVDKARVVKTQPFRADPAKAEVPAEPEAVDQVKAQLGG